MNSTKAYLEGYYEYLLHVRKLTHNSVKDVRCTINKVFKFIEVKGIDDQFWHFEQDDFIAFFNWASEDGMSPKSCQKFVAHLRGFLEYSWRIGKLHKNVLDGFSIKSSHARNKPRVLSIEEVTKFIKSLPQVTKIEREKRLIVLTLYGLGVRTSELCKLNLEHIDLDKRQAYIVESKNDINRYIPIPDGLFIELVIHIKGMRRKKGPLFQTHHKYRRLSVAYVGQIVKEASVRAGIEKVTPKTFRHSFGTHMVERGTPLEVLASLMGHKSPKETSAYLHSLEENRLESVNQLEDTLAKEDE